jgi:hypothetical protein
MVSRKPDAICFHCGMKLEQCDLDYGTYMNMNEDDRDLYKDNFIKRMIAYHGKVLQS